MFVHGIRHFSDDPPDGFAVDVSTSELRDDYAEWPEKVILSLTFL